MIVIHVNDMPQTGHQRDREMKIITSYIIHIKNTITGRCHVLIEYFYLARSLL